MNELFSIGITKVKVSMLQIEQTSSECKTYVCSNKITGPFANCRIIDESCIKPICRTTIFLALKELP